MKALLVLGLFAPIAPPRPSPEHGRCGPHGVTCRQGHWHHALHLPGGGGEVSVDGVGGSDAGITVMRTVGLASDFYLTFGVAHGCVIVKPGEQGPSADPGVSACRLGLRRPKNRPGAESWPESQSAIQEVT